MRQPRRQHGCGDGIPHTAWAPLLRACTIQFLPHATRARCDVAARAPLRRWSRHSRCRCYLRARWRATRPACARARCLRSKALAGMNVAREVNVNTLTYYLNLQCARPPAAAPARARRRRPGAHASQATEERCEEGVV